MIFINCKGKFIEINKYELKNDKLYYAKILELKQSVKEKTAELKTFDDKNKQYANKNCEHITAHQIHD